MISFKMIHDRVSNFDLTTLWVLYRTVQKKNGIPLPRRHDSYKQRMLRRIFSHETI